MPLIHLLLKQFEEKYNKEKTLDEAVTHHLLHYDWKGNVRELINILERLVVISPSALITVDQLPEYIKDSVGPAPFPIDEIQTLSEMMDAMEKQILLKARKKYKTTVRMAEALGISQPSIVRKMKKHEIL
ncbi:hypothetical protein MGI18_17005 [Bacillus sp. OVS6]|nr:hypothetical protein MGI18_17005 [Bacillus sp. OVS6]